MKDKSTAEKNYFPKKKVARAITKYAIIVEKGTI